MKSCSLFSHTFNMRLVRWNHVGNMFVRVKTKNCPNGSRATSATWLFLGARKTCNFATFFLFDFNKYIMKSCYLFSRTMNMMIVR